MKTCILADNQFVTNEGLTALLEKIGTENIVRVRAMTELLEKLKIFPDAVVVLDYALFDFTSMQQMLNVKSAFKESLWILFSNDFGEHFLRYVLLSDPAISVVMKNDSGEEIMLALQNARYNMPYVCESVEQILRHDVPVNTDNVPVNLTATEKIILHEIAMGKTTKEIAYEKNLSFHTVNSHRKNIFRKLEINNVHEAVKYAIRAGIFDVAEYYI
ncbi:MAG: response regulator transcription factor [Dysgonamonadaceae bacterium]|jgi:DNA-binding NarL/FixJ family response regulator|nr:response regulator transcription factor [Dysgonamonadaceae bacterium]